MAQSCTIMHRLDGNDVDGSQVREAPAETYGTENVVKVGEEDFWAACYGDLKVEAKRGNKMVGARLVWLGGPGGDYRASS